MAGCKGRALRLAGEDCKNIRGMILWSDDSLPAPVCRGRKTLLGVPRGQSPLASLAKEKMPIGVFDEAVQCGLPLCETCLFFSRRFGSLGGRRGKNCAFAICPGGDTRCRYGEHECQFRQEVMFMFFILANEEGANSPVDYLPLRSGLVSTAREEMIWVRTAPISFLVNRLALASNRYCAE